MYIEDSFIARKMVRKRRKYLIVFMNNRVASAITKLGVISIYARRLVI